MLKDPEVIDINVKLVLEEKHGEIQVNVPLKLSNSNLSAPFEPSIIEIVSLKPEEIKDFRILITRTPKETFTCTFLDLAIENITNGKWLVPRYKSDWNGTYVEFEYEDLGAKHKTIDASAGSKYKSIDTYIMDRGPCFGHRPGASGFPPGSSGFPSHRQSIEGFHPHKAPPVLSRQSLDDGVPRPVLKYRLSLDDGLCKRQPHVDLEKKTKVVKEIAQELERHK